jgi:hypothetical protein
MDAVNLSREMWKCQIGGGCGSNHMRDLRYISVGEDSEARFSLPSVAWILYHAGMMSMKAARKSLLFASWFLTFIANSSLIMFSGSLPNPRKS